MDPDTNLSELLQLAERIKSVRYNQDGTLAATEAAYVAELAATMSELAVDLDQWIVKGGFLPARWRTA